MVWQPPNMAANCPATNNLTACSSFGMVYLNLVTQLYGAIPEADKPDQKPVDNEVYDFIVVGAGAAGSIVASRITENPDWSVLLLEAGDYQADITRVPGLATTMLGSNVDWAFPLQKSETSCLARGGVCGWPRGKMMGGSGSINSYVYVRGNKLDYDDWARLGNVGWSYDEVLPYFKKSEMNLDLDYVDRALHGFQGRQPIGFWNYWDRGSSFIVDTFQDLGLKKLDFNGYSQDGTSFSQATTKDGLRYSAYNSYIEPFRDERKNLVVRSGSLVNKVLINKKKRAIGVQYVKDGKVYTARARKEVVVSAGTVRSPQVLMWSGIGIKEHLEECGIPVIKDLPVGDNLHDHVTSNSIVIALGNASEPATHDEILNTLSEYKEMPLPKQGPLSGNGPVSSLGFVRLRENAQAPEVQFQFNNIVSWEEYVADPINYDKTMSIMPTFTYNAIIPRPSVLRIKSKGWLRLNTTDPYGYPLLNPNYFGDMEDYETLFLGMKYMLQMENTETFKRTGAHFVKIPLPACKQHEWGTDEYLDCVIRQYTASPYHAAGSVKMGPKCDPTAVVDERLRVYGISSLRVIDGSIMPDVNRGNTNAPTLMIGEKGADMVIQDWSNKRQRA